MLLKVHCSIIYNCQDMEATWVSINRWMGKDVVYIYIYIYTYTHTMEHYSALNKDENLLVTANLDEFGGNCAKWMKSKANTVWYHLHVESKKIQWTSKCNKKEADSDIENKLVVTSVERGRGRMGWGNGRHKLLHKRQIQGCIIQHRKYSQYFVITVNGK